MSSSPASSARGTDAEIRAVFAGLMLAMLLAALDQNIVAVALPQIGADLQGLDMLAWVVSSYLIASAVATPVFGKLGDLLGRRAALSAAIGFFVAGAVACALAPSMTLLVVARALQGIGGGAIIAVAQAAVADVVAPRERGRYQIYFSGVHVVASVAGPVAGGLLAQYLSWHWIFWIAVPLGLLALVISRRTLLRFAPPRTEVRIDWPGALLLTAGLVALLVGITRAGMNVPISAPAQLGMGAAAIVLLGAFAWWEGRVSEPLVPLSLFAIPTVRLSCFILFVGYMQLVALSVLVPMRLQMLTGAPAGEAALGLLPLTLAGPAGAWLGGRIMQKSGGTRAPQAWGAGLVAAGLFALGSAHALAGAELVVLAVIGLGIGLQFPTSLVAIQNAVPARHVGIATAAAAFSRSLGAAIGLAVLGAVLVTLLGEEGGMRRLLEAAPSHGLLVRARAAFDTLFLISGALAASSFLAALLLPPSRLRAY